MENQQVAHRKPGFLNATKAGNQPSKLSKTVPEAWDAARQFRSYADVAGPAHSQG